MVPLPCRILISAASFFVPAAKRSEWKREWDAELWHFAQAGSDSRDLLHRAFGAFRDAAWLYRERIKQHGFDPFRRALRVEAYFLAFAVLIYFAAGAYKLPRLPFADAGRLVLPQCQIPFMGALDPFMHPKALDFLRKAHSFQQVAAFRPWRGPVMGLRVSRDFFDVLGSKPMMGRTFAPNDALRTIVLAYPTWRDRLHADPNVLGSVYKVEFREFIVIGVMKPDFQFSSAKIEFFVPFDPWADTVAGVARLRPGVTIEAAQQEISDMARGLRTDWPRRRFIVAPVVKDPRLSNLIFAAELSLICALIAPVYLVFKRHGSWRYQAVLGIRALIVTAALSIIRISIPEPSSGGPFSTQVILFWLFLLVCFAALTLLVIDHRERCQVCLRRLRKPVPMGTWSSQVLDRPATEYVCPAGHGTLYINETGNTPDHWTVLDESWRDLFVHHEN